MFFAMILDLCVAMNLSLPRPQLWHTLVIHRPSHRMPLLVLCYNGLLLKLSWMKKKKKSLFHKQTHDNHLRFKIQILWVLILKIPLSWILNITYWNYMSFINCIPESNQNKLFWSSLKMEHPLTFRTKLSESYTLKIRFYTSCVKSTAAFIDSEDLCDISLAKTNNIFTSI